MAFWLSVNSRFRGFFQFGLGFAWEMTATGYPQSPDTETCSTGDEQRQLAFPQGRLPGLGKDVQANSLFSTPPSPFSPP